MATRPCLPRDGARGRRPIARLRPPSPAPSPRWPGSACPSSSAGSSAAPSLLASIGEFVIDHQPPGAKDFVVGLFGTNDKLALEVLILVLAALIGALLGIAAVRWSFAIAGAGFSAFAVAGFFASLSSPRRRRPPR